MKNRNRLIMGTAISLAAIASAIDHTRHRLPDAQDAPAEVNIIIEGDQESSPCSMGGDEPSADTSPCGLG